MTRRVSASWRKISRRYEKINDIAIRADVVAVKGREAIAAVEGFLLRPGQHVVAVACPALTVIDQVTFCFNSREVVQIIKSIKDILPPQPYPQKALSTTTTRDLNHTNIIPGFNPSEKSLRIDIWLR